VIEIDQIDAGRLAGVVGLLTDIDDTLSTRGKLTARAFEGLWLLREAGLRVAVVTGRPAGWCDHIARSWPVDAVVGENGGFYFWHDGRKLQRRYLYGEAERQAFRARLRGVAERILREVPGAAIASDQPYREYDVAVDFCEDVPPLPRAQVLRIVEIFEEAGAHARISSIHVNGWYGEFDKLTTTRLWARERLGVELDAARGSFVYCGDSPNDEPMFAFFPLSFGMANVRPFLPLMRRTPAFVTTKECGEGFRQVVDLILRARGAGRA
jgi:HAD superfamily hydrolase (TIGR01484 family)